jgi:hypothetical protein
VKSFSLVDFDLRRNFWLSRQTVDRLTNKWQNLELFNAEVGDDDFKILFFIQRQTIGT